MKNGSISSSSSGCGAIRRRAPSENEFKEEHYRRIALCEPSIFRRHPAPGWQTDRGHMYILYGPPDEIESHPSPDAAAPFEEWLYHYVDGAGDNVIFRFTDTLRNGEYGLTSIRSPR